MGDSDASRQRFRQPDDRSKKRAPARSSRAGIAPMPVTLSSPAADHAFLASAVPGPTALILALTAIAACGIAVRGLRFSSNIPERVQFDDLNVNITIRDVSLQELGACRKSSDTHLAFSDLLVSAMSSNANATSTRAKHQSAVSKHCTMYPNPRISSTGFRR